jgi:hypothetical protein
MRIVDPDTGRSSIEFGCVWEEEHGAGVMTHIGRVIATGQAHCSFTEWIARQGLDRLERRKGKKRL